MAILDFLNKKRESQSEPFVPEPFVPKPSPPRGPGGKFISKEKLEEPKEEIKKEVVKEKPETKRSQAPKGPFMAPFSGMEVRRFYAGKWYFVIADLLSLLSADPPLKSLVNLKNDEKVGKVFEKNTKKIKDVDCSDSSGSIEILRETIRNFNAEFPGSIFRWLEDISKLPFNITEPSETPMTNITQGNPSDRG